MSLRILICSLFAVEKRTFNQQGNGEKVVAVSRVGIERKSKENNNHPPFLLFTISLSLRLIFSVFLFWRA